MINQAKVQLSPLEMELVTNATWILTKNNILQKVMDLLGTVQYLQQEYLKSPASLYLPEETLRTSAKISKGEKYRGLPYLVLDQPRFFNKEDIFAIRHLFWWGNFFSSTLHLSGAYKVKYEHKLTAAFDLLKNEQFFVCVGAAQWEHHFEKENFVPVGNLTYKEFEETVLSNTFIKLSRKILLGEWNNVTAYLFENFRRYISLLEN